jgi:hypothetical protein
LLAVLTVSINTMGVCLIAGNFSRFSTKCCDATAIVYLDTLLQELQRIGLGCHIGQWFAAALAYADDVVL